MKLRLVQLEDAEFILTLRMDERLNRFISMVEAGLNKQVAWLVSYKAREANGEEYYFIRVPAEVPDNEIGGRFGDGAGLREAIRPIGLARARGKLRILADDVRRLTAHHDGNILAAGFIKQPAGDVRTAGGQAVVHDDA